MAEIELKDASDGSKILQEDAQQQYLQSYNVTLFTLLEKINFLQAHSGILGNIDIWKGQKRRLGEPRMVFLMRAMNSPPPKTPG